MKRIFILISAFSILSCAGVDESINKEQSFKSEPTIPVVSKSLPKEEEKRPEETEKREEERVEEKQEPIPEEEAELVSQPEKPEEKPETMEPKIAKSEAATEKEEPEKKKPPPELSRAELEQLAVMALPESQLAIQNDTGIVSIAFDINQDSLSDIFLLSIETDKPESARYETLSDYSRLYDEDAEALPFFFHMFKQLEGGLIHYRTFDLGRKLVFEQWSIKQIRNNSQLPILVNITFAIPEGREHFIYSFSGLDISSLITIREGSQRKMKIDDINNDGNLDFLLFQRVIEEGIGFEKYITWYEFREGEYSQFKTTNVVRNLRRFISKVKSYIETEQWAFLLEHALLPAVLSGLQESGAEKEDIISSLFNAEPFSHEEPKPFNYHQNDLDVKKVVFPEITEDPFSPLGESVFTPLLRVVCCNGDYDLFTCSIAMNDNPFSEHQFFFLLDNME